jgi:tetratricopeptide (TPR) repeat protein
MSIQAEVTKKPERQSRTLVVGVLALTLLVMALGAAVLVVKLRPDSTAPSKTEQSLSAWEQEIADNPDSADAQTGYGMALLGVGQVEKAQAAFEQALRLDANNWTANFQLGLLLREANPDRAVALLQAAAKSASTDDKAVVLIALGDFFLGNGDADGARDAYQRSIASVPYLFDSHYGLAQAFEQLGERRQAIKQYEEALRFAPDDQRITDALDRLKHKNDESGS